MADIMREWNEALTAPKCEHGHLAPVCDLCKKDAQIAALRAEAEQLRKYLDTAQRRASALGDEVAGLREDAERLDWLLYKLPGDSLRYVLGELSDTSDEAEFRAAIDAARKGTT